tara:strand:- start:851 stop:1225 length:375 start_codon:yes stop_codon:yes gene_type:complete
MDLDQDLLESEYKDDLSILREAWKIEIDKPGCSQCIKNAAQNKYGQIAHNIIEHNLSIEDSKKVHDMRMELNKEHQEVQQRINSQIESEISKMKGDEPAKEKSPFDVSTSDSQADDSFNPFLNQ